MKKMAISKKLIDNSVVVLYWDGVHHEYVINGSMDENPLTFNSFEMARRIFDSYVKEMSFINKR
jgi:hypothetical protein